MTQPIQILDANNNPINALRPIEDTIIDLSDGSTSAAFTSNGVLRIVLKSASGTVEIKPNPDDTDKIYIPQNSPELFRVNIGDKVKVVSSTANLVLLA